MILGGPYMWFSSTFYDLCDVTVLHEFAWFSMMCYRFDMALNLFVYGSMLIYMDWIMFVSVFHVFESLVSLDLMPCHTLWLPCQRVPTSFPDWVPGKALLTSVHISVMLWLSRCASKLHLVFVFLVSFLKETSSAEAMNWNWRYHVSLHMILHYRVSSCIQIVSCYILG